MKIGIIGSGGAGTSAAWMLDADHDVTLFERNAVLGGHALTIEVEIDGRMHYVNPGFNWFSDTMYPTFMRLLELHHIEISKMPMQGLFYDRRSERPTYLPPTGPSRLVRMCLAKHMLPQLLQMQYTARAAAPIVHQRLTDLTFAEFRERLNTTKWFKSEFLVPMISAMWGAPHELVERMSAYVLMKYIVLHNPSGFRPYVWNTITHGSSSYIKKVAHSLVRATIYPRCEIVDVQVAPEASKPEIVVVDRNGTRQRFDHVIVAVGAKDAACILRHTRGMERARAALDEFEYYTAQVYTHRDASWMPRRRRDWSIVNLIYDGTCADATVWEGWRTGADLFDSYVYGDEPRDVVDVSSFRLPLETPEFFAAQRRLAEIQGEHHIWFAGDYTRDIGSHEDAIRSAVSVVRQIDPTARNYSQLVDGQG